MEEVLHCSHSDNYITIKRDERSNTSVFWCLQCNAPLPDYTRQDRLFQRYVEIYDDSGVASGCPFQHLEKIISKYGKKGVRLRFRDGLDDPNDLLEEMSSLMANYAWMLMKKRKRETVASRDITDAIDYICRTSLYHACKLLNLKMI